MLEETGPGCDGYAGTGRDPGAALRRDRHLQEHPVEARIGPAQAQPRAAAADRPGSPGALDELVGTPAIGDPRIPLDATQTRSNGQVVYPLSRQPRDLHAWKVVIPPESGAPQMRRTRATSGSMCRRFGSANDQPVEILSLLSQHGERAHGDAHHDATDPPTGRESR